MNLENEIRKLIRDRKRMEAKIGDIDEEIEHILVRLEADPRLARSLAFEEDRVEDDEEELGAYLGP